MHRTSVRTRIVAGLSTLAVVCGSMVLLAPPASAAPLAATLASASPTTVHVNGANQAAGAWTVTISDAIAIGDTVKIQIDDFELDFNCDAAGDFIGFGATPTVTVAPGNTAAFSAVLSQSATCDGPNINDTLTLTATAVGGSGAVVTLSNVAYTVGPDVTTGFVVYSVNDALGTIVGSNAAISDARVDSGSPATLLNPIGTEQPIPNIVLSELRPSAIPLAVCIQLWSPTSPATVTFDTAPLPTVTSTNGDGAASVASVTSNVIQLDIDTASTDTTDYTVSGIRLNGAPAGVLGPVEATVSNCSAEPYSVYEQLAFFGSTFRTAGTDRYDTAAKLAADEFNAITSDRCLNGKFVVVARGDNFPDALAASYLAGRNDVPILLTRPGDLPTQTATALAHHGVTDVVLVGGTAAISNAVATAIDNTPVTACPGGPLPTENQTIDVTRVFGADRYATAKAVAETAGLGNAGTADTGFDGASCAPVKTAIVASGENFPDALAAGGLAYGGLKGLCGNGPLPLLLTPAGTLSPSTSSAITALGISQVILVGGPAAVSDVVKDAIDALTGVSVVRVAGPDRQATAVALAGRIGLDTQGGYKTVFLVARPDNFPDALAASTRSGRNGWPLYLAASPTALGDTASFFIVFHPNTTLYYAGVLVGGTSALSNAVATQVGTSIASQFEPPVGPPAG